MKKFLALLLTAVLLCSLLCAPASAETVLDTIKNKFGQTATASYALPGGAVFTVPAAYTVIILGDGSGMDEALTAMACHAYGQIPGNAAYFTFCVTSIPDLAGLSFTDCSPADQNEFADALCSSVASSLGQSSVEWSLVNDYEHTVIRIEPIDISALVDTEFWVADAIAIENGFMYQINFYAPTYEEALENLLDMLYTVGNIVLP